METAKRVLIVDDDAVVSRIYSGLLTKSGFNVDIASDGETAISKLKAAAPDLVLLDIFMPKVNGVEVLKFMKGDLRLMNLPVVMFSTSSTSRHIDAALRIGVTKVVAKDHFEPNQLVDLLQGVIAAEEAKKASKALPSEGEGGEGAGRVLTLEEIQEQSAAALMPLREDLRTRWQAFVNSENDSSRIPKLSEVRRVVQAITDLAQKAQFERFRLLTKVLDILLRELEEHPQQINPSTMRTSGQAVDLIAILCNLQINALADSPLASSVLVVDRTISSFDHITAFRSACLGLVTINDATSGLKLLEQNRFHCVFWDMEMPVVNGEEMCQRLRAIPLHKKTPIVLLTKPNDFENQVTTGLKGASDLIARPCISGEMAMKALNHVLREQLTAYAS